MPVLLQYLFKLSLTLAVLYLFYYLLLRKLTFYSWNRVYLLGYSLLSFIIPFVNITPWIYDQPIASNSLIRGISLFSKLHPVAAVAPVTQKVTLFSAYDIVVLLFVAGAVVMLVRFLLQLAAIRSIKRKATLIQTDNIRMYDVDGPISPFSFARSIFINTRRHSEEDLQKIIQHEFVHVKQQHTVDLLVGELLCIVNWYNPFAWLIKKAIRQNLEFIADQGVLQTGLDVKQYQYLLLQVTGLQQYSVSNNFTISSLKQRIIMMNKLKSARAHLLKFFFVLPLLAVLLLAFREQQQAKRQRDQTSQNSVLANDTIPPKPPVAPPVKAKPRKNIPPPPPPAPAVPPAPPALPQEVNSISFSSKATVVLKNGKKEEYDLSKQDEKAAYEKKYGKIPPPPPGVNEVVVMGKKLEKGEKKPVPPNLPVVEVDLDTMKAPVVVDVDLDSLVIKPVVQVTTEKPKILYVVDGTLLPNQAALNMLDNQKIAQIDMLEGKQAAAIYGDKAADGVMVITTENSRKKTVKMDEGEKKLMELFNKALIIINGKEASKSDVLRMLSNPPKSISMYTSPQGDKKYGEKGKNGVIVLKIDQ
ncbi:MAG: hypothetical protein INR73_27865 [Williamsia sp.]|nr:hypothetical protein [Williamsia sp.]